jgi:serine protease Do
MEKNNMRTTFLSRSRRWIAASALAIVVGLGGGTAFLAATSQIATAQIRPAQIQVPAAQPEEGFADLVEAVSPAVVSIIVEGEEQNNFRREFNFDIPDLPEGSPFRDFFEQFGDQFGGQGGEQPQRQRRMMAAGSGFVVSPDGYIVTNNHVVEDADKVTVVFENGNELSATIVGTDPRTDLAVVKVDSSEQLPYVEFADKDARVGDWVVAVGNPFGLGGTVTVGVVSARGRDIGGSSYGDFLQIDAAVNTGNSGGPTFNLEGQVVGVNTAIFSPNGGSVGIAFAIPYTTVKSVVDQLREKGTVTRGFLGVSIQDLNRDLADSLGLEQSRGALVTQPTEDGPGGKAGINSGDVIIAVDGEEIDNALDLSRTIASKAPGATVELKVWSNGAEKTLPVTLGELTETETAALEEQPPAPVEPQAPEPSSVGLTLVPNAGGQGLLVQEVDPESIAAEKGFAVGDTVLSVDNKEVASAEDFEAAIAGVKDSGRGTALIKAERDGNIRFLGLPLAENDNG